MRAKMKGFFYKAGFKCIANIFVKRELEIGLPTDVKHVAHIGWDGTAGAAPSWMNGFKTVPQFATSSIGNSGLNLSPWSSQDIVENEENQPRNEEVKDGEGGEEGEEKEEEEEEEGASSDAPSIRKGKQKRKKNRSNSTPASATTRSRSSRGTKSKSKFVHPNQKSAPNIKVA